MDVVTIGFLAVGTAGAVLLAASFLLGEIAHVGHPDADGPFSLPALAGFVGALGFLGAIGAELAGGSGSAALLVGALVGLAGAFPVGWLVARLSRSLAGMHTDGTLAASDLIGATGIVVTRIPKDGFGEVRVVAGGQPLKLNARSDESLPAGATVFVIAVPSESSVVVVETTAIS